MAQWDILHVKSLEVEHSVPEAKIIEDLQEGRLSRDDCVRKPGEDRWWRIYEVKAFRSGADSADLLDEPPRLDDASLRHILADAEPPQGTRRARPSIPTAAESTARSRQTAAATEGVALTGESPIAAVVEEPEEGLPYRKRHREEPEELDMTPMVDVAMQLILFFMVTSSIIMQMCLSFPTPAPDDSNRPTAKPTPIKLDDMRTDHIMVKIKGDNAIFVDEEKQPTKDSELAAKFEEIKHNRNPNGGIVIQADEAAYHETVVKVVDAANIARIDQIKMANPQKAAKKAVKKKAPK